MSLELAALILAGGYSRRMGRDKAWVTWQGLPLWQHVAQHLRQQQTAAPLPIWVNTRAPSPAFDAAITQGMLTGQVHDAPTYAGLGPLAGMHAGLGAIDCEYLLVAPCDTPRLPLDLLQRLTAAQAPVAVAATHSPSGIRIHPTVALLHRDALTTIEAQLDASDLKLMHWLDRQPHATVVWDDEAAFANVNDAQALAALGT